MNRWLLLMTSAVFLSVLVAAAPAQSIWHVDAAAAPGGDGRNWNSAFSELQSALLAAQAGDEVRVAGGIYLPDFVPDSGQHTRDRTATFVLISYVTVRGGYAGSAGPDPNARDIQRYETVLSGDLANDDGPDFANNGENAYHVVTADGTPPETLLDGVTITAGNANGSEQPANCFGGPEPWIPCDSNDDCGDAPCVSINSIGAGIIGFGANATLDHCRITANFAAFQGGGIQLKAHSDPLIRNTVFSFNRALDNGGAMYNGDSKPWLVSCSFIGNSGQHYAGAICNRDRSDAVIIDCLFADNTAAEVTTTGGGAIVNASSSPMIMGCVFQNNRSLVGNGGAVYGKDSFTPRQGPSHPLISDCVFIENSADTGGAIYGLGANVTVYDSDFLDNTAAGFGGGGMWNDGGIVLVDGSTFIGNSGFNGGGIYNGNHAQPWIADSYFEDNWASAENGGAISNVETDGVIQDCTFVGNRVIGEAFSVGGAVSNYLSNPQLIGCLFVGNTATFGGGAIYNESAEALPTLTVVNRCTFRENAAPIGGAMYNFVSSPMVSNCVFTDNTATTYGGAISGDFASNPAITNCTIAFNSAQIGAGVNNFNILGAPTLTNCVVWGNTPDQVTDSVPSFSTVRYSNIQGGWSGRGEGNMDLPPLFVNAAAGNVHLTAASPCINSGDNTAVPADGLDVDGEQRIGDGTVDLGADEFHGPCPGDLDGDGAIGPPDLARLLADWGAAMQSPADLSGNGTVDSADVAILLQNWGPCEN